MTHLRAALSILACRALEAHYRRNLARVVPQPEPAPEPKWLDPNVVTVRIKQRAELQLLSGLADVDFAAWQQERERDVQAGESA